MCCVTLLGLCEPKSEPLSSLCASLTQRPCWVPNVHCVLSTLGRWDLLPEGRWQRCLWGMERGQLSDDKGLRESFINNFTNQILDLEKSSGRTMWGASCSQCWGRCDLCVPDRTVGSLFLWRTSNQLSALYVGWAKYYILSNIPEPPMAFV